MDIIAGHWQWIINFEEKLRSFNYCNLKNCLLDGPGAGQHIIRTKAMLGFPIFPYTHVSIRGIFTQSIAGGCLIVPAYDHAGFILVSEPWLHKKHQKYIHMYLHKHWNQCGPLVSFLAAFIFITFLIYLRLNNSQSRILFK